MKTSWVDVKRSLWLAHKTAQAHSSLHRPRKATYRVHSTTRRVSTEGGSFCESWGHVTGNILLCSKTSKSYAVGQLVVALRYKPEGRGFVSRW